MQVFINEKSLHGQFTVHTVENAIRTFINTIQTINDYRLDSRVFTTQYFFNFNAINGVHLNSTLEANKELKNTFFQNIRGASKWEDQRLHSNTSSYVSNEINYVDSSIGELAERKIQNGDLKGFLLNFKLSIFDDSVQIDVLKDGAVNVSLDCTKDEDSIMDWLIRNNYIDPDEVYDLNSRSSPLDHQTVLRDNNIFQGMSIRNQGRKVYRRIDTDELWVVDNLHYGNDSHIEVFHRTSREHLGTSPYNEIRLETRYRVEGRTITL